MSKLTTKSILGAEYPVTPSNLVTASLINNIEEGTVTTEQLNNVGEDLPALHSEILSLTLMLSAYANGELTDVYLPPEAARESLSALKLLATSNADSDDAFFQIFTKAAMVWPDLIEADHRETLATEKRARNQLSNGGTVDSPSVRGLSLDAVQIGSLIVSIKKYAMDVARNAKEAFEVEIK